MSREVSKALNQAKHYKTKILFLNTQTIPSVLFPLQFHQPLYTPGFHQDRAFYNYSKN